MRPDSAVSGLAAVAAALFAGALNGCAFAPSEAPHPEPAPAEAPAAPDPADDAEPPADETRSAPAQPRTEVDPAPAPTPVTVLLPADADSFAPVLDGLQARLQADRFRVLPVHVDDEDALGRLAAAAPGYVIAVGSAAARIALEQPDATVILCQITETAPAGGDVYRIAATPPPALQLKAWKQLDPTLARVVLFVERNDGRLAAQARRAGETVGVDVEVHEASSDREALYLLRRLDTDLDGLWLLPDNDVLGPRVLREMLAHAASRRLQSLAFTPALLEWGALLGVEGTDEDLAAALAGAVERLEAGGDVPDVTPLVELEVTVDTQQAERLGLDPPARTWIVRDEDT